MEGVPVLRDNEIKTHVDRGYEKGRISVRMKESGYVDHVHTMSLKILLFCGL